MLVELYTTEDLSQKIHDSLQQNSWDFEVKIHVINPETFELKGLRTGAIFYSAQGVYLGSREGQLPLDFSWEKKAQKWRSEASKHPLKKAIGKERGAIVIDATVGFGGDTSVLLALGYKVDGYERNPAVFLCLYLSQLRERFFLESLKLHFGQVKENPEGHPIYFDPMYEDGDSRKAKPTKEMEVFHHVIGPDDDAILEAQRLKDLTKRFVVKRSPRNPPLLEKVNSQWKSKALRLDLYL